MPNYKVRAFSIVEIMAIILIVLLLAAIASPSYFKYIEKTRVLDGVKVLEEYKAIANNLYITSGETSIDPYYVLFTSENTTGYVSGTAGGNSAVKSVNNEFVDRVEAYRPSTGSDYILIGARLVTDGRNITSSNNYVYISGTPAANGSIEWLCGSSASKANSVSSDLLPSDCKSTLP